METRPWRGKTVWDFFPRDIATLYDGDDQYVLTTGAPIRHREEPARPAAPNIDWLATTKMPLRDGSGRIIGLVGVSTDITQRKIDEEKLRMFAAPARALERGAGEFRLGRFARFAGAPAENPGLRRPAQGQVRGRSLATRVAIISRAWTMPRSACRRSSRICSSSPA
jgi:hypothetical protein